MSADAYFRQISAFTTYYDAATILSFPYNLVYEYYKVENGPYAPGLMTSNAGLGLAELIQQLVSIYGIGAFVLRDMGITVRSRYISGQYVPPIIPIAYFRQVQLLLPKTSNIYQDQLTYKLYVSELGGPNGSTYGVLGPAEVIKDGQVFVDVCTSYLTFFVPVVVEGIGAEGATATGAFIMAGGQM